MATSFDLTHFNPGLLSEADFLAAFIARTAELRFFLNQTRITQDGVPARHHLLIGPRGYGKTTLLRRLQIALRTEEEFKIRFLPLTFREEQHNVISLDIFWRNCIQALADAREDEGADETEIEALEALWEQSAPRNQLKRDRQDGAPMYATFRQECRRLGRRPVLLIDNVDTLLLGLGEHQWGLRAILQAADGPVLIAAAPRYPESLSDHEAAFFDFFHITTLSVLSDQEVHDCLRELAIKRGERGQGVRQMLTSDPGRISALNRMAGGNPRTLGVLYIVLEAHMSDDILAQLSAMLDIFTGWYQSRVEELPPQGRAVFDALALNWDPMTAAQTSAVTGLDTPTVSSQLTRLEKSGHVESVPLSKSKKTRNGYQVSERFFNIWYLMRNGPRRTRKAINFLTKFLQTCFSRQELRGMAKGVLQMDGRLETSLALASCRLDVRLRRKLLDHAETMTTTSTLAEFQPIIEELRAATGSGKKKSEKKTEWNVLKIARRGLKYFADGEFEKAEQALRKAIELEPDNVLLWFLLDATLGNLGKEGEAEQAFRKAIELEPDNAAAWSNLGVTLRNLGREGEAEQAYRKAIELEPDNANGWHIWGITLSTLGKEGEAEQAYRKALELKPDDAKAWNNLGNIQTRMGNYVEAEDAYKKALAIDPSDVNALVNYAGLCIFYLREPNKARNLLDQLWDRIPAGIHSLLSAALIWSEGDVSQAWKFFDNAIRSEEPLLWSDCLDDLQKFLAAIVQRGDGPDFVEKMKAAGYDQQYAPLYHAVRALVEGEDYLLRINPEVRDMATKIYERATRMLATLCSSFCEE